jgi:hypothetical protein
MLAKIKRTFARRLTLPSSWRRTVLADPRVKKKRLNKFRFWKLPSIQSSIASNQVELGEKVFYD